MNKFVRALYMGLLLLFIALGGYHACGDDSTTPPPDGAVKQDTGATDALMDGMTSD